MRSCRGVCSGEFGIPIDLRLAWGYAVALTYTGVLWIQGFYGVILRLSRPEAWGILPQMMKRQQIEHVVETGVDVGVRLHVCGYGRLIHSIATAFTKIRQSSEH